MIVIICNIKAFERELRTKQNTEALNGWIYLKLLILVPFIRSCSALGCTWCRKNWL